MCGLETEVLGPGAQNFSARKEGHLEVVALLTEGRGDREAPAALCANAVRLGVSTQDAASAQEGFIRLSCMLRRDTLSTILQFR